MIHTPVLLKEVLEILDLQSNEDVIDATINGGGHAEKILARISPRGKLLGIDRDPSIIKEAKQRLHSFGDRLVLACGNFRTIASIARKTNFVRPHGILFDLGFSSYHMSSAGRGFSFMKNEPLDMRYNPEENSLTAEAIITRAPREELRRIFSEYGEERHARDIAEAIIKERAHRRIATTSDLASLCERVLPRTKIHPATRIFQALRIAVNDELGSLREGLLGAYQILVPGGRMAVISFHSLEDRIVKNFFKEIINEGIVITKKPVIATRDEIKANPRARSAKLRAFQKA